MTGQSDHPAGWLTLRQALDAYGLSERTLRRRLATGEIEGFKVTGSKGQEWRIAPPTGRPAPGAALDDQAPPTGAGAALIPLADIERLLAPLAVERDRLAGQVETLQAARLDDAQEIGRLRGLLEAAQGEVERLRSGQGSAPAPPLNNAEQQAPPVEAPRSPARRRFRWPWQR